MDRRTTLARMLGQRRSDKAVKSGAAEPMITLASSLTPYTGTFGFDQAAHLLRRTTFGASYQQIKEVANMGLDDAMSLICEPLAMPEPPLNPDFMGDPGAGIGETWVDSINDVSVNGLPGYRVQSLRAWTLQLIQSEGLNLREKMVLFWHNHYPIADIQDQRFVYDYCQLIREYTLGNFRELTKAMTVNPAMLRYLNGNDNTAASPNENYARELLELFSIGKGPQVGPGDYSNYTEQDVIEMAKILTGWRDRGFNTQDANDPSIYAQFLPNRHNTSTKQLSYRFDDVQVLNMGEQEYAHLIDIIFLKEECARFICRKLYRWFVYYEIPQQVEEEVIAPMAQLMFDNDYEIRPALEALLRSEHFYDILNVGPMIKNPIDFTTNVFKVFDIDLSEANLAQRYAVFWQVQRNTVNMQMAYYDPPSVAGWKAYYQEPIFYRHWISSVTLPYRQTYTNRMLAQGINVTGFKAKIDALQFVATLDTPEIADNLIEELVKILFPQPVTPSQHSYLKSILLPGLPDYEWNIEYSSHINDPDDQNLANAVRNKLTNLLSAMMNMPEFYLS